MTFEPRTGRATIMDVARAASVSRQTVSNAVNAPERVSPETLERVLREVDRLGFRPSRAAQSLKNQRAGAWGIELDSHGFGRLGTVLDIFLVDLTARARGHDSHIVPFTAKDPQQPIDAYEDLVASRIADGFVLTDTRREDPRPVWLEANQIPFVSFGRIWDDPSITTWVDIDGAAGLDAAVRHLADRGFERIGFLGWPEGSPVGDDRRGGWARATEELGIAHPDWHATSEQRLESAAAAAAPLIDRLGTGGALVCASDALAVGAWKVLVERHLEPGREFGLVGFDDTDLAPAIGLTTLRQPLELVAESLLEMLGNGTTTQASSNGGILLPPELVIRSSTAAGEHTTPERGMP